MEAGSYLKSLLQFQLASDASAARYLPYCLSTLTPDCLLPSSHRTKWTTRISSLLHSREPSARWAGLCLAYKSSLLSQIVMIECAQSWLSVVTPMFTKNEPTPVLKAGLRLISTIFTSAVDIAEFNRQICVPNAAKVSSAIFPFADNHPDTELKVIAMETLIRLVRQYPTAHRAISPQLTTFTLRYLNGSPTSRSNTEVVHAAAELYATLPLTGGKVGGVSLWRKSVDETLSFAWDAFSALRTTFPVQDRDPQVIPPGADPQVHIQLNLDRLRSAVAVFEHLLCAHMQRAVQIPLGRVIKLVIALLSVNSEEKVDGFVDPFIRTLEVAITPEICSLGSDFLFCLTQRTPVRIDAHASRILSILVFQLEQSPLLHLKCKLLMALLALLKACHPPDSSTLITRIGQSALQTVSKVVITSNKIKNGEGPSAIKSGKKKAHNFEGEEVFKTSRQIVCPTREDEEALLASIEVLEHILQFPGLPPSMHSAIARVVISITITLPRLPFSSVSLEPSFSFELRSKIQKIALVIGQGTTSVMSKSLPFVLGEGFSSDDLEMQRQLETLIHPRLPPLVRAMPLLEALSLFKVEESQEEAEILASIAVESRPELELPTTMEPEDISMSDAVPETTEAAGMAFKLPVTEPAPEARTTTQLAPLPPSEPPQSFDKIETPKLAIAERPAITVPQPSTITKLAVSTSINPHPPAYSSMATLNDDEEEMPGINMDSDSEIDEE